MEGISAHWIWRLMGRNKQKAGLWGSGCPVTVCCALQPRAVSQVWYCLSLAQTPSLGPPRSCLCRKAIREKAEGSQAWTGVAEEVHPPSNHLPQRAHHTAHPEAWTAEERGPGSPAYFSKAQKPTAYKVSVWG